MVTRNGHVYLDARMLLGALVAALLPASALAQKPAPSPQDTVAALQLLRRATFGVRPEDLTQVLEQGRAAWLDRQLHPDRVHDDDLSDRLDPFPAAAAPIMQLVRQYTPPRPPPAPGDSMGRRQLTPDEQRMRAEQNPQRILFDMVGAKLVRAVWSERQLEEVMTDFWFNHFNVYFLKGQDRYLVSDYERTAIRPHVFGRFEDMLRATAQHPAMLFYLDNWTSSAPDSNAQDGRGREQREQLLERLRSMSPEQRAQLVRNGRITQQQLDRLEQSNFQLPPQRERGINENYARELMELHTLGVDGGYTQDDVINVARAFTGWTFQAGALRAGGPGAAGMRPNGRPGLRGGRAGLGGRGRRALPPMGGPDMMMGPPADAGFVFRPELHDRGEKLVLGKKLKAGRGMEDGEDVLHLLATQPATAKHIAGEMIQWFVSDTPDPAFVDELAAVFTKTNGDLREVTRALFTSPRFYDAKNVNAKIKSPFELVASALRVTRSDVGPSRALAGMLRNLGELPYGEIAPTGYPGASQEWVNSGSMLNRMNFALGLASGRMDGVRPSYSRIGLRPGSDPDAVLGDMLAALMPGVRTDALAADIRADLAQQAANPNATPRMLAGRALALALGSSEFQRR